MWNQPVSWDDVASMAVGRPKLDFHTVRRLLLSFQIFERLGGIVLLTNDSELILEVTCA